MKKDKNIENIINSMRNSRLKLGLSRQKMAQEIGSSYQTIGKIENNQISNNFFIKYLNYLHQNGIDLNMIFADGDWVGDD